MKKVKKVTSAISFLLLSNMLVLSACSNTASTDASNGDPSKSEPPKAADNNAAKDDVAKTTGKKDVSGDITVWGFTDKVFQEVADAFMKEYPKVKVNTVILDFGALHDKLQTTLAAGTGAPDVAEVEQGQFPRYTTGNVLEDLLKYNAGQYKSDVADYNWQRWMSVDGKKLLGMPWDITPTVYYYRSDIFEELGLPSDPTELGTYMQDSESFLNIAQKLKANGKYFMEWRDGPIHWAGDQIGYFDTNLNWLRNNDSLVKILDATKRGNQLGWAPHKSGLFSDEGKAMVKKGDLVGMAVGSWGARELENSFPEQKGKWRATNLPMGINFGGGGSSLVLPSQSKNKEAAYAYIEWSMRSEEAWKIWTKYSIEPGWKNIASRPWYSDHKSEYLGGQQDYKFYETLVDKIPVKRLTSLDGKGWNIWLKGVLDALDKNIDSKTTLQKIQDDAKAQLAPDIEKYKKDIQQ